MATSSILGGQPAPRKAKGRDTDALGPSDSSDSGSDVQDERRMPTMPDNPGELGAIPADTDSDTDALGTGERASATGDRIREAADILPDRVGAEGDTAAARDLEDLAAEEESDTDAEENGETDAGGTQAGGDAGLGKAPARRSSPKARRHR